MQNFLIFLPESKYDWEKGYLYGVIFHSLSGTAVYVLGNLCGDRCQYSSLYETVGLVDLQNCPANSENWVFITLKDRQIETVSVTSNKSCNVIIVLFNKSHFKRSQLLKKVQFQPDDFSYRLICEIKEEPVICCSIQENNLRYLCCMNIILRCLQCILTLTRNKWVAPIFKVSSFGSHVVNILETFVLLLNHVIAENRCSLKFVNYIIARILDTVFGLIIIFYITNSTSIYKIFFFFTEIQESTIINLKSMVEWLMGSPAGFKLNHSLNNILGPFYQFHISLWDTFLKLSKPFLQLIFNSFLLWGSLGLSFQVAVFADLLAVVSVHIYCIYVYASRIYYFQMKGLIILARLFIGRKKNPLPGKEYAPPYTTEELLFGTVSFTILLFLLPTTLIYYSVFTAIRIALIFFGGILIRLKFFMNIFPVYITWLWFFDYIPLTSTVRLSKKRNHLPDGTLVTVVKPVCTSFLETVVMCIPESICKPEKIGWKKLTSHVIVGNLIYRV